MAYPTGSFTSFLTNTGIAYLYDEFQSFYARLQGYLSKQHNSDGSHGDVTAYSLDLRRDTANSQTGDLTMDGDLDCDGNVTADADGSPVLIGATGSGPGVDMQESSIRHWRMAVAPSVFGGGTGVALVDVENAGTVSSVFGWYRTSAAGTSPATYALVPTNSSVSMKLGEGSSGRRFSEAHVSSGYYERLRPLPMGEWTDYTPSWTNLTVGNGTVSGRYMRIGKTTFFTVRVLFGTTTSIGGSVVMSTPTTMNGALSATGVSVARCTYRDASATARYPGYAMVTTDTTVTLFDGGNPYNVLSSTNPFTWGQDDTLFVQGHYEEA